MSNGSSSGSDRAAVNKESANGDKSADVNMEDDNTAGNINGNGVAASSPGGHYGESARPIITPTGAARQNRTA